MILMKMYSELPLVFDHVKKVKKQKSIKHWFILFGIDVKNHFFFLGGYSP